MSIRYQFSCDDVGSSDLESLFAAAKLGGRVGDKLRRAFQNSHAVCLAYEGDRLIGASRAITDGEYHAVIYDVAVWPEYQGRGIGAQMLQELLARLPVWRVMLVADSDVQGFYRKAGFDEYPNVMARLDASRLYDVAPSKS